jgi:hypothetical protein
MEFGGKRGLDDWIYAKSRMDEVELRVPESLPKDSASIADDAFRFSKVITSIQDGVRERFRALAAGKK